MSSIDLSLYKIADALQLPLHYQDGQISGERAAVWNTLGLKIPFTIKAEKMFAGEQIGVVCHVMGDLHLLVSHFPKTGAVSAYLIDADKLEMDGVKAPPELFISKKMDLKEVVAALKPGMVASFYWKNDSWRPLKLPT